MHRGGAIAEFRRSDGELEAAVFPQRNPAVRYMSGWRDGIDHGGRDALADEPIGGKVCFWSLGLHRALDQIEALIEAVTAINDVGVFRVRRRQHWISGFYDVAAAKFERIDAQSPREFVDRGFPRELRLRKAITSKSPCGHGVGIGE